MTGRIQRAHPDALQKVLEALGAPRRLVQLPPAAARTPARRRKKETFAALPFRKAWLSSRHSWGLFLPLHALYSARSRGAGDFSDLAAWVRWIGARGGRWAGTLPLLPTYLDCPFEPSPYRPISRLFWSEFWLDLTAVPEWDRCPTARRLAPGKPAGPYIDYRGLMKKKRAALEAMSRVFFQAGGSRRGSFTAFLRQNPRVKEYALFRARQEKSDSVRYHEYVQWLSQEQIEEATRVGRRAGVRLFLDLPLGVHPDGYDAWAYRNLFVPGMSVGAPPDPFFAKGQNWGFAPLHPRKMIQEEGQRYFSDCLAHPMRVAGLLRIDHVMSLHRLFWIPAGMPASMGVYVRYPAEDLYRVICRESQRHRCEVVGEDLGTVPPEVRSSMRRHRLRRMFVLPFELKADPARPFPAPPADSVASMNTHDLPPFEAFWRASKNLRKIWPGSGRHLLDHWLSALAAGPAGILMISLEDLWSERRPQNVPGTSWGKPNWKRRARFPLERFTRMKGVLATLREIDHLRSVC